MRNAARTANLLVAGILSSVALRGQEAPTPDLLVPAQRWALVVGASDYEYLGRLRYATNDAHDFADALVTRLGFARDTVRVLTDDAEDPKLTPTAGHLIGELEALLADPRRNQSDLFVFYFCGHGVGLDDGDYLLPTDARKESRARVGLPIREIVDRLATAGMRNVLVLADACREGTENTFGRELWQLANAARLSVVLGCEPGKKSYEEAFFGHGIFTHFLLEAMADDSMRDPASGALWASRVLGAAADRVRERTARRDPIQRPVVWTDPTRDVLLNATLPGSVSEATVSGFVSDAGRLSPESRRAAFARYAFDLFARGQIDAAIDVLKTTEQLGPLPPELAQLLGGSLLYVGRSVEAARTFKALRESAPDSFPALAATVSDSSGAVPDADRARAAAEIWNRGAQVPFGLLLRMVIAQLAGGSANTAHEMAVTAVAQAPSGSRDRAYLDAMIAILERRPEDALVQLQLAEQAAGEFPPDEHLAYERMSILETTRGPVAALAFLDRCVERWPESGEWYARRAWIRRRAASTATELTPMLDDVTAALARSLEPSTLLLVVRAAGSYAVEMPDAIATRAAEHPLAWEAQLAGVFARQPDDLKDQVAAVARLSARPAIVYATMARLTLDSAFDRLARFEVELPAEAPQLIGLRNELKQLVRVLFERIAPMAPEFGGDASAWALLADLSERLLSYEAFQRLFEREFATAIDTGTLPEDLVVIGMPACLNTGRLERGRQIAKSMLSDRADREAMRWLEIAFLACRGDDAAALTLSEATPLPSAVGVAQFAPLVRALTLARSGQPEQARALMPQTTPRTALERSLTGLVCRALGDDVRARELLEMLRSANPGNAFFAFIALWESEPGVDHRDFAQCAAMFQPGSPLLRSSTFADTTGLEPFLGTLEFSITDASGPVDVIGADLTLTVTRQGKVRGTLELSDGNALVVRGTIDEFGNLEGQLVQESRTLTLLAKLAPRDTYHDYGNLAETGQFVMVLDTDGVPYGWICRPAW